MNGEARQLLRLRSFQPVRDEAAVGLHTVEEVVRAVLGVLVATRAARVHLEPAIIGRGASEDFLLFEVVPRHVIFDEVLRHTVAPAAFFPAHGRGRRQLEHVAIVGFGVHHYAAVEAAVYWLARYGTQVPFEFVVLLLSARVACARPGKIEVGAALRRTLILPPCCCTTMPLAQQAVQQNGVLGTLRAIRVARLHVCSVLRQEPLLAQVAQHWRHRGKWWTSREDAGSVCRWCWRRAWRGWK